MRGSNAKPASEASEAPFVPGEKEPRQKPKGNYRKALREIVENSWENSWSCFTTVKTTGNIYLYNHYGATEKCDVLPVGTIVKLDNRKATGNRILIVDNSDSKINDKYVSLNSLNFELVEEQE